MLSYFVYLSCGECYHSHSFRLAQSHLCCLCVFFWEVAILFMVLWIMLGFIFNQQLLCFICIVCAIICALVVNLVVLVDILSFSFLLFSIFIVIVVIFCLKSLPDFLLLTLLFFFLMFWDLKFFSFNFEIGLLFICHWNWHFNESWCQRFVWVFPWSIQGKKVLYCIVISNYKYKINHISNSSIATVTHLCCAQRYVTLQFNSWSLLFQLNIVLFLQFFNFFGISLIDEDLGHAQEENKVLCYIFMFVFGIFHIDCRNIFTNPWSFWFCFWKDIFWNLNFRMKSEIRNKCVLFCSDEGKVRKLLKAEPLPDGTGHFFNLSKSQ